MALDNILESHFAPEGWERVEEREFRDEDIVEALESHALPATTERVAIARTKLLTWGFTEAPSPDEVDDEAIEIAMEYAEAFWTKVGKQNGWDLSDKTLTVYLNRRGQVVDSTYQDYSEPKTVVVDAESKVVLRIRDR